MKVSVRDKILRAAHDLFYQEGIRTTGVDKIIAAAGVTKVTFYRHFPSKNDLVYAFLEYRHQRWISWFTETLARHGAQPGGGLQPLLPTLAEWFNNPVFRGCAFINSIAELSTLEEVVAISKRHKQEMTAIIAGLLPLTDKQAVLANAVAIAVDGAIVKAQLEVAGQGETTALQGLAVLLQALAL